MRTGICAVNEYPGVLIDSAEIQDDIPVTPLLRYREFTLIYHFLTGSYPPAYTAACTFRAKRNIDLLPVSSRFVHAASYGHESPFTVKAKPFLPLELRTGIYFVPLIVHDCFPFC